MEPFPDRYRRALADEQLRRNLLEFQRHWRATRDRGVAGLPYDELRRKLVTVKNEVIADLPGWVETFRRNAEAGGAHTYFAASAEDAARYVTDLAQARGIRVVTKSKSMLSEEIHVNDALGREGIEPIETDLGEWIVQLAGERPSHIVAPAVHKNRRQVADLLERVIGEPVDHEDIGQQVAAARRHLRNLFFAGGMGLSGANAIVAESGTVVLVTNEGNAELVTSLPPIHVVLAGIEKLVPTVEDAMTVLELLAPSATGQRATSYVTFISGPDSPQRELHIVLVDNGRSVMAASPLFRDALRCIRCGSCASVCPAYGVVGGHVFGHVYTGAIGLVNTPFHHGLQADAGPQSLCVSCNACQTVCPVDIPLPRQILDTRAEVVEAQRSSALVGFGLAMWSRPRIAHALLRTSALLQVPVRRDRFVEPPFLARWTSWRTPPALARRPFRDDIARMPEPTPIATGPALSPAPSAVEGFPGPVPGPAWPLAGVTVAYFVQCLTDWLYPEMGRAIVQVLRDLGATVAIPRAQHCCGLPAIDSGHPDRARGMARHTISVLEACDTEYVVTGGTSCAVAFSHDYVHLFRDDAAWRARAERLAARTRDFTTFLLEVGTLPEIPAQPQPIRAVYHYFCQSYNVLGFREEPFRLLRDICGLEIEPMPEANVCCGFGGSVSVNRPELCRHILERKLDNLDQCNVPLLVTDNPGCIMHLRGGINASGRRVRVRHTAEIVAERLAEAAAGGKSAAV